MLFWGVRGAQEMNTGLSGTQTSIHRMHGRTPAVERFIVDEIRKSLEAKL